jgi:hypothetical protein
VTNKDKKQEGQPEQEANKRKKIQRSSKADEGFPATVEV